MSIKSVIEEKTPFAVQAIKDAVQSVSVTGKTALSVRPEIVEQQNITTLFIYARKYFAAIETGRGPRKSTTYGGFDKSLLEWMDARGIGNGLTPKKKQQLAKFLAYKINKEGDELYKHGGRLVYSPILTKFIAELKKALIEDYKKQLKFDIIAVIKAAK